MADLGIMTVELLRINFGERVPGFSQALARALSVSVPELIQKVESGELSNEDALSALGAVAIEKKRKADKIMRIAGEMAAIACERATTKEWENHPMFGISVDHDKWAIVYQRKLEEMRCELI